MSSSGALLTLAARGPQDVYLTGNPDTSYFRQVYKRHTNFTFTEVRQVMEGSIGSNSMTEVNISRQGDLLSYVYLSSTDPQYVDTTISGGVGNWLVDSLDKVVLKIGGQEIVTMTSTDIKLHVDLMSETMSKSWSLRFHGVCPLPFWFTKWSAALPMCALQYHDVKLQFHWASTVPAPSSITCHANMIFIDNKERSMLTQAPELNYIIQQYQRSQPLEDNTTSSQRIALEFNNPVQALMIHSLNPTTHPLTFKLMTNSVELLNSTWLRAQYRRTYHTSNNVAGDNPIIPFCLDVSSEQPTGSINFSRLDTVELVTDANTTAFAFHYSTIWGV